MDLYRRALARRADNGKEKKKPLKGAVTKLKAVTGLKGKEKPPVHIPHDSTFLHSEVPPSPPPPALPPPSEAHGSAGHGPNANRPPPPVTLPAPKSPTGSLNANFQLPGGRSLGPLQVANPGPPSPKSRRSLDDAPVGDRRGPVDPKPYQRRGLRWD